MDEELFLKAASSGRVEEMKEILRSNPAVDVNWTQDLSKWSPLLRACHKGHNSVTELLLAHPDINVNHKHENGGTPFMMTCYYGSTGCARLLLKDPRVLVNEPYDDRETPLWWASRGGHLDIIMLWIASGREMDLGMPEDERTDAIGMAKKNGKTEVVALLERFKSDAAQIRYEVRVELGLLDEAAAEVFALVVFVSDGLLQIKDAASSAARFFSIATQLPLELQMVLCYRVVGSAKEIIPGKDSEVAFKELAKRLLWSSFFTK